MFKRISTLVFNNRFLFVVVIALLIIIFITFDKRECLTDKFDSLEPKALFGDYKIYDLIEQKGLACAEAIEILKSDENYDYYFSCLKSSEIYLVSEYEVIKVKNAYEAGIITITDLYELNIIERMQKNM